MPVRLLAVGISPADLDRWDPVSIRGGAAPLAPLFPAAVAVVASVLPFKSHSHVARGAFYACLGAVAFEAVFVPILLLR
jgi:hypothetical protein